MDELAQIPLKTHYLFALSDRVISINSIIGDYARKFNKAVSIVPNFVDTDKFCPLKKDVNGPPEIVWTGSVSTLQNLDTIAGALRRLQENFDVPVRHSCER